MSGIRSACMTVVLVWTSYTAAVIPLHLGAHALRSAREIGNDSCWQAPATLTFIFFPG